MSSQSQSETPENKGFSLTPYLSPLAVLALSIGYAVGWGSFVLPGTVFLPNAGPVGTMLGILIGTAAVCVLAYNYHLLAVRLKGHGGAYGFVSHVFGHDHGFLVAWILFLSYIAILWANATALVLLVRYLFGNALQFGFHYTMLGFDIYFGEVLLCLAAIVLCGSACLYSKRLAIRLHTFFTGVLVFGVLICFGAALFKHEGGLAAMGPAFSPDGAPSIQTLRILAMVPWAFVGFEAIVHSASEFRFPVKRTFSLLLTAVLISALLYLLLVLLPLLALPEGYSTWPKYIAALPQLEGIRSMPVFSAAKQALGPLGVAIISAAMLSGQLTALFATFIAVSRLMRSMSEGCMVPAWFGKCNQDGTPANAVLFIMCISLPIPFLGRTVIGWPVDLSNLGAAVAYGYTSSAAFTMLKQENPSGHLAAKAAGIFGVAMSFIFAMLMIVPNYLSGSSLSTESYLLLAVWCIVGFILYRRAYRLDKQEHYGNTVVVWISVLVLIFFSSLMWFRMAVCDASRSVFKNLVGHMVTSDTYDWYTGHVSSDMKIKSIVELGLLLSSLTIIINLFSIHRKRERELLIENERLKAEEITNKSKSYFFSTFSHDIRTPLNAIIGFSEMLKMGFKTEAEREQALDSVVSSGKTLLHLIDDVLDFSKLEANKLDIRPEPTDCAELLQGIVESRQKRPQANHVELRCRPGDVPMLLVDPVRVRQILFNLVDNAIKFTESGHVELRSSFVKGEDGNTGTLRLDVEDTGCGISENDLKRIASPYVKVESKLARHGGTGLGLALCHQLAIAMGGKLTVVSTLGKGSTFTLTLSNVKLTGQTPADAPAEAAPADVFDVRRILIVDDQKMNLMVLAAMLKKLGTFEVVTASNGQEALEAMEASDKPFDLVLTDMWMPTMDGEALLRAIRTNDRFSNIPVHVVTADMEMKDRHAQMGFTGFLLKPITVDKLKSVMG